MADKEMHSDLDNIPLKKMRTKGRMKSESVALDTSLSKFINEPTNPIAVEDKEPEEVIVGKAKDDVPKQEKIITNQKKIIMQDESEEAIVHKAKDDARKQKKIIESNEKIFMQDEAEGGSGFGGFQDPFELMHTKDGVFAIEGGSVGERRETANDRCCDPSSPVDIEDYLFKIIDRFVCLMTDKTEVESTLREAMSKFPGNHKLKEWETKVQTQFGGKSDVNDEICGSSNRYQATMTQQDSYPKLMIQKHRSDVNAHPLGDKKIWEPSVGGRRKRRLFVPASSSESSSTGRSYARHPGSTYFDEIKNAACSPLLKIVVATSFPFQCQLLTACK